MIKFLILNLILIAQAWAIETIPFNLHNLNEDQILEKATSAKLLALEDAHSPYDHKKEPLILVHGIRGQPSDLQNIVDRFSGSSYQIYILAYDDFGTKTSLNGEAFAKEIKALKHKSITIVAHSMGGIVSRKALADLVTENEITNEMHINIYTIDTPWHGFDGPADGEFHGLQMKVASLFLPDGLEDMRAKSDFFKDLNKVIFPENIKFHLAFAEEGPDALDYTEGFPDEFQEENFLSALRLSENFSEAYPDHLNEYFPRFPGNHMSVLDTHHQRLSYIDYLADQLL